MKHVQRNIQSCALLGVLSKSLLFTILVMQSGVMAGCNGGSEWRVHEVGTKEGLPTDWIEESQQRIIAPVVSPDGKFSIVIGMNGDVRLYASQSTEDPVRLHAGLEATHAAFSPTGEEYVIGTSTGKLIFISTETGNELGVLEHEELGSICTIRFEDNRHLTALNENGVVVQWEKD